MPDEEKIIHSSRLGSQPTPSFQASTCVNSTNIGSNCSIPGTVCATLTPCQNDGNCTNINTVQKGYQCVCVPDFNGTQCQWDRRPCRSGTCLNNGACNASLQGVFTCACARGWQGSRCETQVDNCGNVTCLNKGVCRSSSLNYTCQCLDESYSGRHCELKANAIVIRRVVSLSFGYIGILALVTVLGCVLFMDVLKYGFGIDPARDDLEKMQHKKAVKKNRTAIRFIYVHPSTTRTVQSNSV